MKKLLLKYLLIIIAIMIGTMFLFFLAGFVVGLIEG